jgi:hypothetical protein
MADTIYTRALAEAVETLGGTKALTDALHVPETTLRKWISGRAQMPLLAFHRTISLLREQGGVAPEPAAGQPVETIVFSAGGVRARCAHCGGTEFLSAVRQSALRMSSGLQCAACKAQVMHGELLAALATVAVREQRLRKANRPPAT